MNSSIIPLRACTILQDKWCNVIGPRGGLCSAGFIGLVHVAFADLAIGVAMLLFMLLAASILSINPSPIVDAVQYHEYAASREAGSGTRRSKTTINARRGGQKAYYYPVVEKASLVCCCCRCCCCQIWSAAKKR